MSSSRDHAQGEQRQAETESPLTRLLMLDALKRSFERTRRPIRIAGRIVGIEFDDEAMLDAILAARTDGAKQRQAAPSSATTGDSGTRKNNMNWFKKLFRKKPDKVWRMGPSHIHDLQAVRRPSKSLPPQDVETICREEDSFTYAARSVPVHEVIRAIWLRNEIERLKRNKKKFSHLQAELEELTR